jgi:hypothetical protein
MITFLKYSVLTVPTTVHICFVLQRSRGESEEEPIGGEEQSNTHSEIRDDKAERKSNVGTEGTKIPHKTKEESTNGKLRCHKLCQINMKGYILIPVFDFCEMKTQLTGSLKGNNHTEQILMLYMDVL